MEILMRIPLDENPKGTAQEKGVVSRGGRVHHYEKPEVLKMRHIYYMAIKQEIMRQKLAFYLPIMGAVALDVSFHYQTPKKKLWGQPKETKPDCDNMVKLLQDVLADLGFFAVGDQQVTHLTVRKYWAERPEIHVKVSRHIVWRTST